jgi:hypothetical protein
MEIWTRRGSRRERAKERLLKRKMPDGREREERREKKSCIDGVGGQTWGSDSLHVFRPRRCPGSVVGDRIGG